MIYLYKSKKYKELEHQLANVKNRLEDLMFLYDSKKLEETGEFCADTILKTASKELAKEKFLELVEAKKKELTKKKRFFPYKIIITKIK